MNQLNIIIVDDEPLAIEVLKNYSDKLSELNVLQTFSSSTDALHYVNSTDIKIDIIFLDIQMPDLNGFEFINLLKKKIYVILTTAFSNYALESYKYNVIDYLMKPISFSSFSQSIVKFNELINIVDNNENNFIFINVGGKYIKLEHHEILFINGNGDYVDVNTNKKKYLVRDNLTNLEDILPKRNFIRIHRSYIINIDYVKELNLNFVKINNNSIPISKTYRQSFINIINKNKIG